MYDTVNQPNLIQISPVLTCILKTLLIYVYTIPFFYLTLREGTDEASEVQRIQMLPSVQCDVPSEEHMVANRMNQLVLRALPRNVFLLESELVQSEIC